MYGMDVRTYGQRWYYMTPHWKWWVHKNGQTDERTMNGWTDGHTDVQCETIIPCHYCVVGYKNEKKKKKKKKKNLRESLYKTSSEWWSHISVGFVGKTKYRIQPNYHTVCLGFSKMLGKLVVKYVPTYTKGTLKKIAKDLSNNAYVMFCMFFCLFFFSDFLNKSICCGYSFELHRQVDAIQMGTHNICLYKVDKNTLALIWKLWNCFCALIGVCAVIRSNTIQCLCDPDPPHKFSFPWFMEVPSEIWLKLAQPFWEMFENVDRQKIDDRPKMEPAYTTSS